ncbi:A4/G1 family peptidase [Aspergillus undulatus]|uniref:A4/G1 family peptidase n=1 Tax=Aspergillus undulatus TaxID=1810928 RepID=UPI003CCD628A
MKLSATFSSVLLVGTAVAAPLTAARQARNARRASSSSNRQSHPPYKPDSIELLALTNTSHVEYSSNWAGAVLIGTDYTSVTGEFTVPTPSAPTGGSSFQEYCASAWVGIDGDTCSTAILQTGVDFCIQGGQVSFNAWYEWYPDYAYDFSGIEINAGDQIRVTVDATTLTAGTASVENLSTGQTVTHTFTGGVDGALCEYNAEWIVEDFESDGSLASTSSGTVGPDGAAIIDIQQGSDILTSVSVSGGEVTVEYV